MSAPSHALSFAQEVTGPDVSSIVTEDDTPVDNIYSERQQRLLLTTLYANWPGPPPEEDDLPRTFVAMANVGVFGTATDPPVVPDVLVSLDVAFGEDVLAKENRTYFVWIFGKSPDLVVEVVSNREGEELGKKKLKYRRLHIPSYVVWDPAGHLSDTAFQAFELRGSLYVKKRDTFFEALGLGLVPWEGLFEGCTSRWLRWVDAEGTLLPTGAERAQQADERAQQADERAQQERGRAQQADERAQQADERAQQADERAQQADERTQQADERAQQERERAAGLAEKLRALGIDPDAS